MINETILEAPTRIVLILCCLWIEVQSGPGLRGLGDGTNAI